MKTAREILNKLGGYDLDVDEALRDLDALVPKFYNGTGGIDHANGYNQHADEMHKIFKGDK